MKKRLLIYSITSVLALTFSIGICYYQELLPKNDYKNNEKTKTDHISPGHNNNEKIIEPVHWTQFLTHIRELMESRRKGNKKLKIFISYAWENCNTPEGKEANGRLQSYLEKLRNDLETAGLTVFLDISHMHGNMKNRMRENLDSSDFVFVILTPRFKERIQDKSTNLYFEYDIILEKIKDKPYALIPLHYSGDFKDAVPVELFNYLIRDGRDKKNYKALMVDIQRPLGIIPAIYNIGTDDAAYKKLLSAWRLKHFNNLSFTSNNFIRRKEILNKINLAVSAKKDNNGLTALVGMAGIGKSQLALEFSRQNLYK